MTANEFETFSSDDVTCYSCGGPVAISTVAPVNSFGAGGLYEAQFSNSSSQVVLSPKDSLVRRHVQRVERVDQHLTQNRL